MPGRELPFLCERGNHARKRVSLPMCERESCLEESSLPRCERESCLEESLPPMVGEVPPGICTPVPWWVYYSRVCMVGIPPWVHLSSPAVMLATMLPTAGIQAYRASTLTCRTDYWCNGDSPLTVRWCYCPSVLLSVIVPVRPGSLCALRREEWAQR